MKQFFLCMFYVSGILLAASLGTGCEQHSVFRAFSGPRPGAGLDADGDLLVIPRRVEEGVPGGELLIKDSAGVHILPLPKNPFLALNFDIRYDRASNSVCGIFMREDEQNQLYSCYSFRTRRWKELTPKGSKVGRAIWTADRKTVYLHTTSLDNKYFTPWFFIEEMDVETGKQKSKTILDPRHTAGVPQRMILSPDEKRIYSITAPFAEGSFEVALNEPHILQVIDLEIRQVVHERVIPPYIYQMAFSEDGNTLFLYCRAEKTLYSYDIARDEITPYMTLQPGSSRFFEAYLVPTVEGVFMIDQTDRQTLVRRIDAGADTLETDVLDFVTYQVVASDDGRRLFFRELQLEPEEHGGGTDPNREEVFHAVDASTLDIMYTQKVSLPDSTFRFSTFFALAGDK